MHRVRVADLPECMTENQLVRVYKHHWLVGGSLRERSASCHHAMLFQSFATFPPLVPTHISAQ